MYYMQKRRAVSQVIGSLFALAVVAAVGSLLLLQGQQGIMDFTNTLDVFEKTEKKAAQEIFIIEHVRLDPESDQVEIWLRNTGTIEFTVQQIRMIKIDTQELLIDTDTVDTTIFQEEFAKITLSGDDVTLPSGATTWEDEVRAPDLNDYEYRIFVTTTRNTAQDIVVEVFNTWSKMSFIDNFFHPKLSFCNLNTRRGISDIIVTLLLIAITVVSGVIIFSFFQGADFQQAVSSDLTKPTSFEGDLELIGYDTRDGLTLSGITGLDNNVDGELTVGTDYIVLKFTNQSPRSLFLETIVVNEITHDWDDSGSGNIAPAAATFNIVESNGGAPDVQTTQEIVSGSTVRTVVALSSSISSNIDLNKAIRIQLDLVGSELRNIIVKAGSAK